MQHRHEALLDAAVPLLVGAVIVVGELLHGGRTSRAVAVGLGLAAGAALWGRRRWPGWTLFVSGALVALLLHVDRSAGTVAVLAPAVALYSLALTRGRRAQLLAGLAAVAAVLVADLLHPGPPGLAQTLAHLLLITIPLLAAEAIRTHRSNLALLRDRLELAERARENEAERRVEQERMRIARELHDVVAHTLTEINVQAGAAAERLGSGDPRATFEQIEQASHCALGELRGILGVLREPDGSEPSRAPTPGIGDIERLVGHARESGMNVELEMSGEPPPALADTASLAAYRIVQESLTNARRHAPGAPVRVSLEFNDALLSLAVENGHSSTPANGTPGVGGVGIEGMRERTSALGGTLTAEPTAAGFEVLADLPTRPTA